MFRALLLVAVGQQRRQRRRPAFIKTEHRRAGQEEGGVRIRFGASRPQRSGAGLGGLGSSGGAGEALRRQVGTVVMRSMHVCVQQLRDGLCIHAGCTPCCNLLFSSSVQPGDGAKAAPPMLPLRCASAATACLVISATGTWVHADAPTQCLAWAWHRFPPSLGSICSPRIERASVANRTTLGQELVERWRTDHLQANPPAS